MIRFACPTCNAVFTVGDEKAGKTTNCPKCKAPFQIPEIDPPPAKPAPPPKRPKAEADFEVVEDRPRPRHRREDCENDEDRPRRRPRDDDENDEDRPRRRSRREEDEDDRPRRRERRNDEEDDDRDRPRRPVKKKARTSGLILACGITLLVNALVMAVLSIMDMDEINYTTSFGGGSRTGQREIPTQLYMAALFYQIAVYGSILTALIFLIGSIGLMMHLIFGRTVSLVGGGFSAFMIFSILLYSLLALTYSVGGRSIASEVPARIVLRVLLRLAVHIVPVVMVSVTLFKAHHTKHLRSNL